MPAEHALCVPPTRSVHFAVTGDDETQLEEPLKVDIAMSGVHCPCIFRLGAIARHRGSIIQVWKGYRVLSPPGDVL